MLFERMNLRDARHNLLRNVLMYLVITLGILLVVGLSYSAESITDTVIKGTENNNLEDGNFSVTQELGGEKLSELNAAGIDVEEQFFLDIDIDGDSVLRMYKVREAINKIALDKGNEPQNNNEIVLEKHYAEEHDLSCGSLIKIGESEYKVSGIGSVPDYDNVLKNITDMLAEPDNFGLGFVSAEAFDNMMQSDKLISKEFNYAYKLGSENTDKEIKDSLENDGLSSLITASSNPRIKASSEDVAVNKQFSMYFGILYMALMAYIISVFTSHNIDKHSSVIGTIYAMGITKKKIIGSFILVPAIIALLGGITGTLLGFVLADVLGEDTVKAYSFPEVQHSFSLGLMLYGLVLPVAVTVLVNLFILNKKLSAEPLKLIKKQRASNKTSRLDLNRFSFDTKFRIRQFIREKKNNLSLFIGLFLAVFLMVFGINVYTGVNNYATRLNDDIPFEYMYILKAPAPDVPAEGETAFVKSLDSYCKYADGDLTASLQGISPDSRYFKFDLGTGNEVVVSSAAASKFNWKKGDEITLRDTLEEKDHKFKVKSVEEYGYGLYIFMDIDIMREYFGMDSNYYNIVMSDKALDIDNNYVSSVVNSDDIETTGKKYLDSMMGAIVVLLVLSVVIFIVVMFLLIKMMIDKSTFNISLLKVLGYHENRVKKLYLGSTLYTVIITGIIAVPVCKLAINQIFPYMVYNVAGAFDTSFTVKEYLIIAAIVFASYFLSNLILRRYLKKISLAEILKDRE